MLYVPYRTTTVMQITEYNLLSQSTNVYPFAPKDQYVYFYICVYIYICVYACMHLVINRHTYVHITYMCLRLYMYIRECVLRR